MNVLIHIDITYDTDFVYEKPVITWAKKSFPEIISFDIDNHSDTTLFQYAATLIEKEDKTVIYIDVKNEAASGKFLGLAEAIIKNKAKCLVMMKGESKILLKMFLLMKEHFLRFENIQKTQEQIYKFYV